MENKNAIVAKILACAFMVLSIFYLAFGIWFLFLFGQVISSSKDYLSGPLGIAYLCILLIGIIIGLGLPAVFFIIALGLWKMKERSRKSAFGLVIFSLIISCVGFIAMFLRNDFRNIILGLIWLAINIAIIYYLSRKEIKEQFK